MTLTTLLLYLTACFAVTVTPGPTMLLALANGSSGRWRVAGMGILGAALSDLILIGAVAIGLGALLAASEALFQAIKWLGVAYLAWLSIALWRQAHGGLKPRPDDASQSAAKAFSRSQLVALSNPKGLLFFSAFLPQFINTAEAQAPQYALLAVSTALLDIAVMSCYALGGAQAARLLTVRGLRRLHRACASVLLSLAAFLAVYRRADI